MRMKDQRSHLELFMRKLAEALQIGFQFHYGNRHKDGSKVWALQVWDQRPGHYRYGHENPHLYKDENGNIYEIGYGNSIVNGHGIQDYPHIHWYPKLRSDNCFWFDDHSKFGEKEKDSYICNVLFERDFFKMIAKEIPGMPSSLSEFIMTKAIAGKDRAVDIANEFKELKSKHIKGERI